MKRQKQINEQDMNKKGPKYILNCCKLVLFPFISKFKKKL